MEQAEFERKMAELRAGHEDRMTEIECRSMESAVDQHQFWIDLADRIRSATTIADRQLLADEMLERARVVQEMARTWDDTDNDNRDV